MALADDFRDAASSSPAGQRNLRRLDTFAMLENPAPTVDWIISGIAAAGHLALLAGREKVGKSLVMLHLAAQVANAKATGVNRYVGGVGGIGVAGGSVLLVDAENGEAVLHRRVQTCGLELAGAEHFQVDDAFGFDLADPAQLAGLEQRILELAIDLFVIDGFRAVWRGQEIESSEVAAALDPLRHLCHTSGAAGVLLHHARKASGESADSYRGGTGVGAAVESIVEIARIPGDTDPRRRRIANPSCRFAIEHPTRWIRLGGEDAEHVKIETAEPMLSAGKPRRAEVAENLLDIMLRIARDGEEEAITAADLTRALGLVPPNGTVHRALGELEHNGYVLKGEKGWTATGAGRRYRADGAVA